MLGTPQTTFSIDNPAGKAGMLYDNGNDVHIARGICGTAALDAGVVVEIVPGVGGALPLLQVAQGTGNPDANVVYGITMYKDAIEGAAAGASTLPYQPGDEVPVLKVGRIFAQCVSGTTAGVRGAPANFSHSSTLAGNNGAITSAAASGTAGSEISAFPNGTMTYFKDVGLTSDATQPRLVVEVNMP